MFSSKKLSKYCSNIISVWLDSKKKVAIIPILIAIIPTILKSFIDRSFDVNRLFTSGNIAYIVTLVILFLWYYTCVDTQNKLEADKGYYDTEIIALKEKTIENNQKSSLLYLYSRAIYQISQISKGIDYSLMHARKMLESSFLPPQDVIDITITLMEAFYTIILREYYIGEHEKLNFALYYYSPALKKYFDVISFKHETNKNKKGRIWDENDNSHICFVGRQKTSYTIIYDNINERLPQPLDFKDSDPNIYVSSISVPIKFSNSEHQNFILSLTSNFENRFNNDTPDEVINKINGLFSTSIVNIATLLEIAFEKHLKNKDEDIINIILQEYKKLRPEELTKHNLNGVLSNLS